MALESRMKYREYRLMWGGASPVVCVARTKGEARSIFKRIFNVAPAQRLRMKIRVSGLASPPTPEMVRLGMA